MLWHRVIVAALVVAAYGAGEIAFAQSPGDTPKGCTPMKLAYSEGKWRQARPADGLNVCPAQRKAGARNTIRHFHEYRTYRKIATMKCLPGREGYFVPNPGSCTTLENESGLSWWSINSSSGAEWIYQLLGQHEIPAAVAGFLGTPTVIDGGPRPGTFHNRLVNHEVAAQLSRSSWTASG